VHTGFWWGDMRARDHLEGLGVNRRIILNRFFNKYVWERGIEWIYLA